MLAIFLFSGISLSAEGTREAAPNGSIMIDGNQTTDIAALHLDHPSYNRFASYSNPDANNRLRVRIVNPGEECIYLGFSLGQPSTIVRLDKSDEPIFLGLIKSCLACLGK